MNNIEFLNKIISFDTSVLNDTRAIEYIKGYLENLSFSCKLIQSEQCTNLYAVIGEGKKYIAFAGHIDVVPPGNGWKSDPFKAIEENGIIYGRGIADMKGAIAAFVWAVEEYIKGKDKSDYKISLMIAGDEEVTNNTGTLAILDYLNQKKEKIDLVIVGEPTNPEKMGEMVKIGRRGSMSFDITIEGKQGHAAYPENSVNPLLATANIVSAFYSNKIDEGDDSFTPSNLEVTNIDTNNTSRNVIPGKTLIQCNIRYNIAQSEESLIKYVTDIIENNIGGCSYKMSYINSAKPFLNRNKEAIEYLNKALYKVNRFYPKLSTTGGTSDARFIAEYFPVIEYGLVNKTAHQINECISKKDIENLTNSYLELLNYFYEMA